MKLQPQAWQGCTTSLLAQLPSGGTAVLQPLGALMSPFGSHSCSWPRPRPLSALRGREEGASLANSSKHLLWPCMTEGGWSPPSPVQSSDLRRSFHSCATPQAPRLASQPFAAAVCSLVC